MSDPAITETASESAQAGTETDTGWVPLVEAAKASGMSVSGLRKWYREGRIETRTGPGPTGPRRLVNLETVLARAGRQTPPGPRTGPTPEGLSLIPVSTFNALQVAYLEAQKHGLMAEVEARVAEHDLAREREALKEARQRIATLEEQLDAARRPWWKRKG
jgi:hypothetical protein